MRRPAAALAVAALLLVAGCSAGGDTTTTPEYDTDADPIYETPLDREVVTAAHLDVLRVHETFTIVVDGTTKYGSESKDTRERLVRGNLDTGAVYEHRKFGNVTRQTYRFANGTTYYRGVAAGEVSYGTLDRDSENVTVTVRESLSVPFEVFAFSYAGTRDVDGERLHVYRSRGPDQLDSSTFLRTDENVTVNRAEATLSVRDDGTLREFAYTLEFEDGGRSHLVSAELRFEELGDTDASPPGWIPVARNRTN